MKYKFDWKFAGLVIATSTALWYWGVPPFASVFCIAMLTLSNIAGYTDGVKRGAELMKDKADDFFKQLQQLMADTMHRAKEVVEHERGEAAHLKARLAKYEDVNDVNGPVH